MATVNPENPVQEKEGPDDYTTQLLRLRTLTERFGMIAEPQMLQLRLWPFTVDPQLEKAEAYVDVDNRKIRYIWVANHKKSFQPDKQYQFRLEVLAKSIHVMLGDTWDFTIKLNGATIYPIKKKNGKTRRKKTSSNRKR